MPEKEKRLHGFHADAEAASLFICPHCSMPMSGGREGEAVLRCARGHSFDIARQGYVNLLTRRVNSKYDKRLFQARSLLCRSGLFAPMTGLAAEWLGGRLRTDGLRPAVLDAGCGEGSHLTAIRRLVGGSSESGPIWVGADIAKDGVMLAARSDPQPLWCVADLAHCPLAGGRFDAVLNLLSPSNYSEFARLLADGGLLVKAIPGGGHLRELRGLLYGAESREIPESIEIPENLEISESFEIPESLEIPGRRETPPRRAAANSPFSAATVTGAFSPKRQRESSATADRLRENSAAAAERLFAGKFRLLAKERLTYRYAAGPELAASLVAMTPLSWGADPAVMIPAASGLEVTVDLILLLGEKPSS